MSRGRLERVLPNLSVTGDGLSQLALPQVNQQQRLRQREPHRVVTIGGFDYLLPLLHRFGAVPVIHLGEEIATVATACQPVIASEETVESAGLR
ncbi:MAG: hypothetical protein Q8T13_05130 [Acidobacteriota bacterium]|nr:hypothetical protein [Acidobacteriota bacterium]